MPGYKGSANITFYVERVKDEEGRYHLLKVGDDPERSEELELEISGQSYFQPGKLSGLPEDCYPDEGETEIESITLDGKPWNGELTDKETQEAESKLTEAVQEGAEDDGPPSQDDFDDYDDRDDYPDEDDSDF